MSRIARPNARRECIDLNYPVCRKMSLRVWQSNSKSIVHRGVASTPVELHFAAGQDIVVFGAKVVVGPPSLC